MVALLFLAFWLSKYKSQMEVEKINIIKNVLVWTTNLHKIAIL